MIAPHPATYGLARMYQTVADVGGDRIQVFTREGEALVWLGARITSPQAERKKTHWRHIIINLVRKMVHEIPSKLSHGLRQCRMRASKEAGR
jgi:hypothetical protein